MNKGGCLFGVGYLTLIILLSMAFGDEGIGGAIFLKLVFIFLGLVIVPQIAKQLREKRKQEIVYNEDLENDDLRAPIFYLREFKEDGSHPEQSFSGRVQPLINPFGAADLSYFVTYEEQTVNVLKLAGPVYALSRPAAIHELGAFRVAVDDLHWKTRFAELTEKSSIVFLRAGKSENLLWEIEEIHKNNLLSKLILYLQFGEEKEMEIQRARYHKFVTLTQGIFPIPLPPYNNAFKFIWFSSDNRPHYSEKLISIIDGKGIDREKNIVGLAKGFFPKSKYYLRSNINCSFLCKIRANVTTEKISPILSLILITALGLLHGLTSFYVHPLAGFLSLILITAFLGYLFGRISLIYGNVLPINFWLSFSPLLFIYSSWVLYLFLLSNKLYLNPVSVLSTIDNLIKSIEQLENPDDDQYFGIRYILEVFFTYFLLCFSILGNMPSSYEKKILKLQYDG